MSATTRCVLLSATLALAAAWPATSRAQTSGGIELTQLTRGNYSTDHDTDDPINLADCEGDELWSMTLTTTADITDSHYEFWLGSGCDTEENRNEAAQCDQITDVEGNTTITPIGLGTEVVFSAQTLVGGTCSGRDTETLYILLMSDTTSGDEGQWATGSRDFLYDADLPSAPSDLDATGGEEAANLSWSHASTSDDDHIYYVVYCYPYGSGTSSTTDGDADADADADAGGDADMGDADTDGGSGDGGGGAEPPFTPPIPFADTSCSETAFLPEGSSFEDLEEYECKRIAGSTATSTRVDSLTDGQTYAFSIAAVDEADNVGPSSAPVCATPQPVDDFFELYSGSGGTGGYCFVATAAYGDADHPDVQVLRWFRDHALLPTAAGRWLVAGYYEHGPGWADAVESRPWARGAVRHALVLTSSWIRMGRSPAAPWALVAGALIAGVIVSRRRKTT